MSNAGVPVLEARELACGYDGRAVIDGVSVAIARGEFVTLVGPNGSGKTTLLRALAGSLPVLRGEVLLEGRSLRGRRAPEIARSLSVVPQMSPPPFEFTVREIVQMGRTPHLGRLQSERPIDRQAVARALALTDTEPLAERAVTELSGGEMQRVTIARALAQDTPTMLLDEPAAFLDIKHQLQIFNLLARLNAEEKRTILCVCHDLNLASEYSTRLVILADGQIVAHGSPTDVLTTESIRDVYGCDVMVDASPSGRPRITLLADVPDGGGRQP